MEWDFYFCTLNGQPAAVMLDLDLIRQVPDPARPFLWEVGITLRQPDADGFSTEPETPVLFALEDRLVQTLTDKADTRYVGRTTTARQRTFYFYAPVSFFLHETVGEALEAFPAYPYSAASRSDPGWDFYKEILYPAAQEWQRILTRRMHARLQADGLPPDLPLCIAHRLQFAREHDRSQAEPLLQAAGFLLSEREYLAEAPFPFLLQAIREEAFTLEDLQAVVQWLNQLADQWGGTYGGWSTLSGPA